MTLTADPRWWCYHELDGWRLDLWEGPALRTFGPYPTQGAALGAAFVLGVTILAADDDGRLT